MERIGVVGLGRMGSAMARKLAHAGHTVTGWTRSGRTVQGVAAVPDLAALVEASDALILSLYDDAAVTGMLDALLQHDIAGRLILETSTVVPQILIDRAEAFVAKGAQVVDAPVSGGPEMVEAGTCGFFLGADPDVAERARHVLTSITPRVLHMGPPGAGMAMKTINNAMLQVYGAGLRELLPIAKRAGIPLEAALAVLNGGPAGTAFIRDRMPKITGADATVGFTLNGIHKDNDVFRRVAEGYGLPSPALEIAGEGQARQIAEGLGDLDPAVAIAAAYRDA